MTELMHQILSTPIIPDSLAIWSFGQMGIGIKTPNTMLYIDLCLSDILYEQYSTIWKRAYPPPLAPGELTGVDYYLITHEHPDHLDPLTIEPIYKNNPNIRFVAPGWCVDQLVEIGIPVVQIIVPDTLVETALPESDVRLTAIPSAHYEKEFDTEKGYRWLGYLIESNNVCFYHAGDTIIHEDYIDTLKSLTVPDVAILPVNGRDYYRETEGPAAGNLLPVEASRLVSDLKWDMLLIGHNDMYPFNTIPYSNIVHVLETIAPRQKFKILQPGELLYYVK